MRDRIVMACKAGVQPGWREVKAGRWTKKNHQKQQTTKKKTHTKGEVDETLRWILHMVIFWLLKLRPFGLQHWLLGAWRAMRFVQPVAGRTCCRRSPAQTRRSRQTRPRPDYQNSPVEAIEEQSTGSLRAPTGHWGAPGAPCLGKCPLRRKE